MATFEPIRPIGNEPKVQSDALALASRIAQSKARFFIMLEHHYWQEAEDVFRGEPKAELINADFRHYCSEFPKDVHRISNRIYDETDSGDRFLKIQREENTPEFQIHAIGMLLVTYEEIFMALRKSQPKNEPPLLELVEKFVIGPLQRKEHKNLPRSFSLQQFHASYESARDHGRSIEDAILMQIPERMRQILDRRMAQMGGEQAFMEAFMVELWRVQEILQVWRVYGKTDEASVREMFKAIGDNDRTVIKYGAVHGLVDGVSALLPAQIQLQAQALKQDGSTETMLVVTYENETSLHKILTQQAEKYPLKGDVPVWHYELQRECTFAEWVKQGPEAHRAKPPIIAPDVKL